MSAEIAELEPLPIEYDLLFARGYAYRPHWHKKWVYQTSNGYGLSVVEGSGNYCSMRRDPDDHTTFEVALAYWPEGAGDDEVDIVFADGTPFAWDVQGWQTVEQVTVLLLVASWLTEHSKSLARNLTGS
jgi:hypothetical protein